MKRSLRVCVAASILLPALVHAEERAGKSSLWPTSASASAAPSKSAPPPGTVVYQPPDVAAPKMDWGSGEPQCMFTAFHKSFMRIAAERKTQLIFLGDSITQYWSNAGLATFNKEFGAWHPANFGVGGDGTQHVLWRVENGELDDSSAKLVMLMIGTNNTGAETPEAIARGIDKIVKTILVRAPSTKVLLLGIFPRGEKAKPNPLRDKIIQVNAIIAKLQDKKRVFYRDIGDKFLQPDGSISTEIMADFVHLTPAGYVIWADAVKPTIAELMK